MGKLGNLAYKIGISLNKEDIGNHRQGITPTAQTLQNLSTDVQLAITQDNQAILDGNKEQLEGEKESGDGMYNMPGVAQGVGKTRQKDCRKAGVSPNDCSAYIWARSVSRAKNIASVLVPTSPEEVAFMVATAGGGYVLKVAGKAGVKVIRSFKSKKELDKAVAEAKRVSSTNTRAGYEPDNDLLSSPVSGRVSYNSNSIYSGGLVKVSKPDPDADKLALRLGGESRVRFANSDREFDAISIHYIAQAKPKDYKFNKSGRDQAKATFEAARDNGKKVYYHFNGSAHPDTVRKLNEYSRQYGVEVVIDTKPF